MPIDFNLRNIILLISFLLFSHAALADCIYKDGTSAGHFFMSIPQQRPPRKPAPDTVLWDSGYIHIDPTPHITCLSDTNVYAGYTSAKTLAPGLATPYVYQTGNPGIGLQVITTHDRINKHYMMWPRELEIAHNQAYNQENYFQVKLIATGKPIVSGNLDLSSYDMDRVFGSIYQYTLKFDPTKIIIQAYGCDIDTKDINVALTPGPGASITSLALPGSTTAPVNFDIALTCEVSTNVSIKFSGTTVSGKTNILQPDNISQPGTAQGVGIQILSNNQPIDFGSEYNMINNVSTSQVTLPYQAQIIRLNDAIQTGDINATATFEMIYR